MSQTNPRSFEQERNDWFVQKARLYGITPDDYVPAHELTEDDAVGTRLLLHEPDNQFRDYYIHAVEPTRGPDGEDCPTAMYTTQRGILLGLDADDYTDARRFIPADAEYRVETKEDAITELRHERAADQLRVERVYALAEPWGVTETFCDLWPADEFDTLGAALVVSALVGHGTDHDTVSPGDYWGRAIGGHGKSDRGKYIGNMAVLEREAGMDPEYYRTDAARTEAR